MSSTTKKFENFLIESIGKSRVGYEPLSSASNILKNVIKWNWTEAT